MYGALRARRARFPKAEGEALQNIANARYYLRARNIEPVSGGLSDVLIYDLTYEARRVIRAAAAGYDPSPRCPP